tara:strand:+ start:838 stop:1077 length:240 start_codon:yes stop_codon:yes gene_type:complete
MNDNPTSPSTSKVYPLKMDSNIYLALQTLCKAKGITLKEGLRSAISLFIADNMNLLVSEIQPLADPINENAPSTEEERA